MAASRLQYPVHTRLSSLFHPARHSMPKRVSSGRADQKLKLSDDTRKTQSSTARVRASLLAGVYGSGGTRCRGCVRQVRGVYASDSMRFWICGRVQ